MNNEQWKEDGKCNICRRKNYCNSRCKAAKERQEYEMKCMFIRAMTNVMREQQEGVHQNDER